jgi:hypothetical protein
MATKAEKEKISVVAQANPAVAKNLTACLEIRDSLVEGKSDEQKALEDAIASTSDESLKRALSERLNAIQKRSNVALPEVLKAIEAIGVSVPQILRLGISKYVSQTSYGYVQRSKE